MKTKEAEQIFLEIRSFPCTPEMLSVFIAGQPTAWQLYLLMYYRHATRTPEMLSHFIASRPTAHEIVLIMRDCGEFARTPEMLSHFL
ncbi:MAG TPA: hypothetical protein PLK20_07410, partial [Paludibacteraceae bacterium]|nr:hypothetical protein [Paludibacteraceae bacterium]